MTERERRRQRLMNAIGHWMRRHGLCAALLFSVCLSSSAFAEEETKKPVQPASLMKILSDKDLAKAISPKAANKEAKRASAPKSESRTSAKDEPKKDEVVVEKTLQGTVGFIRKDKMSVEFGVDEENGVQEMLLALDKNIRFSGIKDPAGIQYGDQVRVKFLETTRIPKEKSEKAAVLGRAVTELQFIKAAPKVQKMSPDSLAAGQGL